jgi:hypothetical protein
MRALIFLCGTGGGRFAPQARKIQARVGITPIAHRIAWCYVMLARELSQAKPRELVPG